LPKEAPNEEQSTEYETHSLEINVVCSKTTLNSQHTVIAIQT